MIRIKNLSKSIGKKEILKDITFDIPSGSIYGLIGANGAGKTTLLNVVSGFYLPTSGEVEITVSDTPVAPFDNEAVKRELFYVADDSYFPYLSTLNDLAHYYKRYYPEWSDSAYSAMLELFSLNPKGELSRFSKGMKRIAALLLALSSGAKYLLLDESFDGIDHANRKTALGLLNEYVEKRGATVVISSHNLPELESVCDTVGMISGMSLAFSCDVEEMRGVLTVCHAIIPEDTDAELPSELEAGGVARDGTLLSFITRAPRERIESILSEKFEVRRLDMRPPRLEEIFDYYVPTAPTVTNVFEVLEKGAKDEEKV